MKLSALLLLAFLPSCAGWYAEVRADTGSLDFERPVNSADANSIGIAVGHNFGQAAHQSNVEGLLTKQALFDQEMDRRAAEREQAREQAAAIHRENMEKYALAALTTRGVDVAVLQDATEGELDLSDITTKPADLNSVVVWFIWIIGICGLLLTLSHVGVLHRLLPNKKKPKDEEAE